MKLTLDIETFSRVDLKKVGLYRYAEDESTDILCACWAIDNGPVHAWVPTADFTFAPENVDGEFYFGTEVPWALRAAIEGSSIVANSEGHVIGSRVPTHAWNAMFERKVLNGPAGQRYGFPKLEIRQMRCSMHRARVHGLPGALEDAAEALNAAVKKRKAGQNAMRYLCKPRKDGSQSTAQNEYERFVQLVAYCADDVRAERAVDDIVPALTGDELDIYRMDQEINDRGVKVDVAAVEDLISIVEQYKERLLHKCLEMTKGHTVESSDWLDAPGPAWNPTEKVAISLKYPEGIKPSQAGALADWIRANGFPELENLQADTVRKALLLPLPDNVKTILKLYSTYNMKSVTKLPVMLRALCKDGRIHGMFLVYGAGTGRWSSVIVQLQNLLRPVIDDADTAIEAMRTRMLDWLQALYPGVDSMKVVASCIRGMLVADEGNELVFPDYSGVEARWNAWMFNEEWKLRAYREYDAGIGPNLYCVVYGRCFNVDPNSDEGKAGKQIGKVLDLSMGYEGGVGAYIKMAAAYRIDLSEMADKAWDTLPDWAVEEARESYKLALAQGRGYELSPKVWITCDALKRLWRASHPGIVGGWKALKEAAIRAIENPGLVTSVAEGRLKFKVNDRWLYLRLPSGRKLAYYRPEIKRVKRTGMLDRQGNPLYDKVIYYHGINTVTRKWGRTSTYGGKLCENETQAGCRDLLTGGMHRLEDAGLPLIGSVHDEPIGEAKKGTWSMERAEPLMITGHSPWAAGMPIAVEGHVAHRYRK